MRLEVFSYSITLMLSLGNTFFLLPKERKKTLFTAVIVLNLFFLFVLSWLSKDAIYAKNQDTWTHLALIQKTIEKGVFPGNPFYNGYPTPPHYSLVDIVYVFLSHITGIKALILWGHASPVILPVLFFTIYVWSQELFANKRTALISAVFTSYCLYKAWPYTVIPKHSSLIFFFLTHLFFFHSLRNGRRFCIFAGITLGIAIATHLFTGIMTILSITGFLITYRLCCRRSPAFLLKALLFISLGCIISLPWLLNSLNLILNHQEISPAHYSLPEIEQSYSIFNQTVTILKPVYLWNIVPVPIWILATVGLLLCYRKIKEKTYTYAHIFFLSGVCIPPILLFTPLYPFLKGVVGVWMPPRLLITMPIPFLAGWGAVWLVDRYANPDRKAVSFLLCGLFLFFFFFPIVRHQFHTYYDNIRIRQGDIPAILEKELGIYTDSLKNMTVMSDPWTSYLLPTFTSSYVVVMPPENGSPFIHHEKRMTEVMTVLSGVSNQKKTKQLLDKYHVDYILINLKAYSGNHAHDSPLSGYHIAQKIEQLTGVTMIHQGKKHLLLRYKPQ